MSLWDLTTGKHASLRHDGGVNGATFLPDGRLLSWSWSYDKTLRIWPTSSLSRDYPGLAPITLNGHRGSVLGARIDGGQIVSFSTDRTVRRWDAATGEALAVLKGHKGDVLGAQVLAPGRVVSWSEDQTVRCWDGEAQIAELGCQRERVTSVLVT